MEIALAVLLAFILGAAFTYFYSQAFWNALRELENELYQRITSDTNSIDRDIDAITDRLDALEVKSQLPVGARPPGVYDEYGNMVFAGAATPFGEGEGGIVAVEEELGAFLDASTTDCLDGTQGNEPEEG